MRSRQSVGELLDEARAGDPSVSREAARSLLRLLDLDASREEAAGAVAGLLQESPSEELIVWLVTELHAQWHDYTERQREVIAPAVVKAMKECPAGTAFVGLGELARTMDTTAAVGGLA